MLVPMFALVQARNFRPSPLTFPTRLMPSRDSISCTKAERPGLSAAMEFLREGDVLVIWRLNRLERSLSHLIETVTLLSNIKK